MAESLNSLVERATAREIKAMVEERCGFRISECYQCGKCTAGCPVSYAMDVPPNEVMRLMQLNMVDEALSSEAMWLCVMCETCGTRCPRNVHPGKVFEALKNIVYDRNLKPADDVTAAANAAFLSSARKHGRTDEVEIITTFKFKRAIFSAKVPPIERIKVMLEDVAMAPKLALKGKLRLLPHNVDKRTREIVRKIFERSI
ncbi:MAG: 4Fe-4S dicluster domain-containing protein [bacterium]